MSNIQERRRRRQLAFSPTAVFTTVDNPHRPATTNYVLPTISPRTTSILVPTTVTTIVKSPTQVIRTTTSSLPKLAITTASSTTSSTRSTTSSTTPSTSLRTVPFVTLQASSFLTTLTPTPDPSTSNPTSTDGTSSSSVTPSARTSLSGGSIFGIVVGTLLGVVALCFAVVFWKKRMRQRRNRDFDADAFKRQSVVLIDEQYNPPRSYPTPDGGYVVPSPTMLQRNAAPVAYGTPQAAFSGVGGYNNTPYEGFNQFPVAPSWAPGQIIPSVSEVTSPVPPLALPYAPESSHSSTGATEGQGFNVRPDPAAYSEPSPSSTEPTGQTAGHGSPEGTLDISHQTDYVDLGRSSVSPFQAAQYAEIVRRLNSDPLKPLPPIPEQEAQPSRQTFRNFDDFTTPPDSRGSDDTALAGQAGVRRTLSPLILPSLHTVPESPFADPQQNSSSGKQHTPTRSASSSIVDTQFAVFPLPPGIIVDAEQAEAFGPPSPLPDIKLSASDSMDGSIFTQEFPVSAALSNSFVIPSPTSGSTFADSSAPGSSTLAATTTATATALKPSPLREATTAATSSTVSSPATESSPPPQSSSWKGKGKERATSVHSFEQDAYGGI